MTDLDQEGISGHLRSRFSTYHRVPPRRRLALVGIVVVVLGALGYGLYLWHYWHYHLSTDDAYITAHIAPMSARVPGTVVAVLVDDNQDVKADQVLVRLDPRDYEVAVAQARAAVESARGDLENAAANVPLADESTRSLVQQADAVLGATEHGTEMARHDLDRITALVKSQLVAQQDWDHAEATYRTAEATLDAARRRLEQARSEVAQAEASLRTQQAAVAQSVRRVDESRASLANARSQRQQVKVRQAQVEAAQGRLS